MTKETLEKLPQNVRWQIEEYRKEYTSWKKSIEGVTDRSVAYEMHRIDENRAAACAYCKGLRDAGLITEHERGVLCVWTAQPIMDKEDK